ncbi:MAG: sulfatase-like hydrolase/transferase, partial [Chitinophagales bacterium]
LPEVLKDDGGYFTYALDKVFHTPQQNDFDKASPMCSKTLSWNKLTNINPTEWFVAECLNYSFADYFDWGMIPDSLEGYMEDVIMTDTAINWIHNYAMGTANTCGKPFFMSLGYHQPHSDRFIPEKYFLPYYVNNIYDTPFDIPYNDTVGTVPFNGLVMPPQPNPKYNDYYNLPEDGLGRFFADETDAFEVINDLVDDLPFYPVIDPLLTDAERFDILTETYKSNYAAAYIAAVQFVDAQVGRFLDELKLHPELLENTIIVLIGDHGFSLGEKRHWTKWGMWETDLRIPFAIADPTKPGNQVSNRTISLIDLYPTILDLADVDHPTFADGSQYLDGNSFVDLLTAPDQIREAPSVSTTRKHGGFANCYPTFSVRSERFHYIRYQQNNSGDIATNICDTTADYYEEELYDIGINRETDPNEWNNLAADDEYAPVIDYLTEFLPEGSLYGTIAYTVNISTKPLPCLLNSHTAVKLNSALFSDEGTPITGAATGAYQFKWTNNLTGAIFYGKTYTFNTNTIPGAVFTANDHITFYLEVTELATGDLKAFNTKTLYINKTTAPTGSYSLILDNTAISAKVVSYTLNGSYTDTYWEFGDGTTS